MIVLRYRIHRADDFKPDDVALVPYSDPWVAELVSAMDAVSGTISPGAVPGWIFVGLSGTKLCAADTDTIAA